MRFVFRKTPPVSLRSTAPSKMGPLARPETLPPPPKAVPLGKVAATKGSRRKGSLPPSAKNCIFCKFVLDNRPTFRYNRARSRGKTPHELERSWPGSSGGKSTSLSRRGSSVRARSGSPFAAIAQLVERILGKDEVSSSNLDSSSKGKHLEVSGLRGVFCLSFQPHRKNTAAQLCGGIFHSSPSGIFSASSRYSVSVCCSICCSVQSSCTAPLRSSE